jgi:hypothetical protein
MADSDDSHSPGFAPSDLTDGRRPGEWRTRYTQRQARVWIVIETVFLTALLVGLPVALFLVWHGNLSDWLDVNPERRNEFEAFAESWLGGALGGAVFSMKWLYHSVAHRSWHLDRRLWRFFTPVLSGSFSFALIALATSGLFPVLDSDVIRRPSAVLGISFLLGYFSDNTVGKLAELADNLLGSRPGEEKK